MDELKRNQAQSFVKGDDLIVSNTTKEVGKELCTTLRNANDTESVGAQLINTEETTVSSGEKDSVNFISFKGKPKIDKENDELGNVKNTLDACEKANENAEVIEDLSTEQISEGEKAEFFEKTELPQNSASKIKDVIENSLKSVDKVDELSHFQQIKTPANGQTLEKKDHQNISLNEEDSSSVTSNKIRNNQIFNEKEKSKNNQNVEREAQSEFRGEAKNVELDEGSVSAKSSKSSDNCQSFKRSTSQLTDGDIISLDSSDEDETKTLSSKSPEKVQERNTEKHNSIEVNDCGKDTETIEITMKPSSPMKEDLNQYETVNVLGTPVVNNLDTDVLEMQSLLDAENENYEIFYNKECINYECSKTHKQYYRATHFILSFYNITKKKKSQFVCTDCYFNALEKYEYLCGSLAAKKPILMNYIHAGKPEFVEILDSSDEDEMEACDSNEECDYLSADCLDLIEKELEQTISNAFKNVEIQNQLTWSKTILSCRLKNIEEDTKKIEADLKFLQSKADKMHESLYRNQHIKISNLPPLDLNTGKTYVPNEESLKPFGELTRPPIEINGTYYAVKNKPLASWVPCRVVEKVDIPSGNQKGIPYYKVKFIGSQYHTLKTVPLKHLAYFEAPPVRLQIGTRVIAYFDATTLTKGKEKCAVQSAFYPGIIAEPLKQNNRYRYLIFYDDGYTQYVHPNDVRLVCQQSEKVWEDVHPGSRDFIENYVTQYNVNRPMVQTHKGQSMNTESNGTWIYARVVDIDCSLVKMHFEQGKGHTEWIYRGSLRLGPVFREYHKMQKESNQSRLRRTEPFIRYTADDEMNSMNQNQRPPPLVPIQREQHQYQYQQQGENQQRAVARKTTSRNESQYQMNNASSGTSLSNNTGIIKHLNNETIYLEDENIPKGKVVYYTAKRNLPPKRYRKHNCKKSCLFSIQHNLNVYSPLSKPLLSGWERMIYRQKAKKSVVYRAPCGKMLRDMLEVRNYLRATENVLNVDNFDFRPETCCLAEYVIDKAIITKRDITNGLEKMPLPLVNYYDNTLPDCIYAAQRIPKEDVHINTDIEFLVGCDCEDDCLDKTKCSCWQLTLEGAKYGNPNTPIEEVGYQYKRLMDPVPTGIYECNARCKCKSNCLNRVVQHPLQMKLQVFKTNNRGWGLRCINDIPKGSFICIYAGNLLTNTHANEGGLDAGDEYFAELDLIETAEQYKEGYESDVVPPEPEEDDDSCREEEDDEFRPSKSFLQRSKKERTMRSSQSNNTGNDESKERRLINFNPNADLDESKRKPSIRQFYGNDDGECYVMDAKTIGNLGRYFNHSCSPNLFVQSVFVDTHDLRFPWVAFFSLLDIRAGTELTWNYNYEVGVVPGKVLYCECGAPNCRQRLL